MGAPGPQLSADAAASAVRLAVRRHLGDFSRDELVVVAVSGGRDSLALLYASVAAAPAMGLRVGAATVDHGWHEGSASVAEMVAGAARAAGADPVEVLDGRARPPAGAGSRRASGGPEGRARDARYAALDTAAAGWSARRVLLGHTLDDQAETVLLGLARGSGSRSLAGMAPLRGIYGRPLLGVRRDVVHAALPALAAATGGLPAGLPWEDPANADVTMLRAGVRRDLLPMVQHVLGAGAVEALARTADLLRADADALDEWAATVAAQIAAPDGGGVSAALADIDRLPVAVRSRVLRLLAERGGAAALTATHTATLVRLAEAAAGSGAGPVGLPGGVSARRRHGRLTVGPATGAGDDEGAL